MSILVDMSAAARDTPLAPQEGEGPVILVVDDEPLLRSMLERTLKVSGFRTLVARGGREAVTLYQQFATDISLVLIDVRMPDLNGPATLRALQQLDPDVRCCFMSGDTGDYTEEQLRTAGALHLFVKPFAQGELIAKLRQLTAGARETRHG